MLARQVVRFAKSYSCEMGSGVLFAWSMKHGERQEDERGLRNLCRAGWQGAAWEVGRGVGSLFRQLTH